MSAPTVLAIDTGTDAMGFAAWADPKARPSATPCAAWYYAASNKGEWYNKVMTFCDMIVPMLGEYEVDVQFDLLVLELPEVWFTSAKGLSAAQRGDVEKVAWSGGAIAEALKGFWTELRVVKPREWKGQMNKDLSWARCVKRTGTDRDGRGAKVWSHARDAVGIGLDARGVKLG